MLTEWQKNIRHYIPVKYPGYSFARRISVFIPIKEVGLIIWERRVQSLPFIHESILSALMLGVKSISDLADLFSISDRVAVQIVAQLDQELYVAVSAGSIILTEKGKQLLKEQRKVKIFRQQFNRIYVNQITGELTDTKPSRLYHEPDYDEVYLDEVHATTIDFFHRNVDKLSHIYNENRVESIIFKDKTAMASELYRVLDVSYGNLMYIKEFCFVYVNDEDKSLSLKFESGRREYESAFHDQMSKRKNGTARLLQPYRAVQANAVDIELPETLVEIFGSALNSDVKEEAIETAYYADRPLLDGEIHDIMGNIKHFRPNRIYIRAPYLCDILAEADAGTILSPTVSEIVIVCQPRIKSSDRILNRIKDSIGNRKIECSIKYVNTVDDILVLLDNKCMITAYYYPIQKIYGRKVFKQCANVSFDSDQIADAWSENDSQ